MWLPFEFVKGRLSVCTNIERDVLHEYRAGIFKSFRQLTSQARKFEVLRPINLKKQAIIEAALNEKNVEDDLNLVWSRTQSDLYQVQLFPD